jgi:hypothetical protein
MFSDANSSILVNLIREGLSTSGSASSTHSFQSFLLPILVCSCLALPNIFIQIYTLFTDRKPAPLASFFSSLILNLSYGLLSVSWIEGNELFTIIGPSLFGFWIIFLILNIITYPSCLCGQCSVFHKFRNRVLSNEDLNKRLRANRSSPPCIAVIVTASHIEAREVIYTEAKPSTILWSTEWKRVPKGGNNPRERSNSEIEHRTIKTFETSAPFEYSSWEETAEAVFIPPGNILHLDFKNSIQLDQAAKFRLEEAERVMIGVGKQHDDEAETSVSMNVPNFVEKVVGSLNDEKMAKIRGSFASPCGKFIWFLCLFAGYQSSFECFCNLEVERLTIEIEIGN